MSDISKRFIEKPKDLLSEMNNESAALVAVPVLGEIRRKTK